MTYLCKNLDTIKLQICEKYDHKIMIDTEAEAI